MRAIATMFSPLGKSKHCNMICLKFVITKNTDKNPIYENLRCSMAVLYNASASASCRSNCLPPTHEQLWERVQKKPWRFAKSLHFIFQLQHHVCLLPVQMSALWWINCLMHVNVMRVAIFKLFGKIVKKLRYWYANKKWQIIIQL